MAGKAQDYIPRQEFKLLRFLDNLEVKLPDYGDLFDLNKIDFTNSFAGTVPPGGRVLALFGRFPDSLPVHVLNSGTTTIRFSINATDNGLLQAPITTLAPGAGIDTDILTMGGTGRPFLFIENASATTDGGYALFTSPLGHILDGAARIAAEILKTNSMYTSYKKQLATKNGTKKIRLPEIRLMLKNIKTDKRFTRNIGANLGILSAIASKDLKDTAPVLKAKRKPDGWAISYNLLGFFDGIIIYRKRPGEKDFVFFRVRTTGNSVTDTEPMVNGTEYRAFYMMNDEAVGKESGILVISV